MAVQISCPAKGTRPNNKASYLPIREFVKDLETLMKFFSVGEECDLAKVILPAIRVSLYLVVIVGLDPTIQAQTVEISH